MTSPVIRAAEALGDRPDNPPGMLEYETRTAIRDLIRLHGFEAARELVASYINDEAERKKQ